MSIIQTLVIDVGYVVLGILVLTLSKIIKDVITPFQDDEELTVKDNPALGVSVAGYYAAVFAVFVGAFADSSEVANQTVAFDLKQLSMEMLLVLGYSLGGIVLLNLSRFIVDHLMLYKFSVTKEILEDRNSGSGAVECGNYVASGLIIAGAIHGEGGGPLTALVFFFLGQFVLILYGLFYQLTTKYDIHKEIEADNVPAGVAMGGNIIAIGIILLKSLKGDFEGWLSNITDFFILAAVGFVVLFIIRLVFDWMMLPRATLTHEIAVDRNINAAYLESTVLIGTAVVIFFAI
ncbi:DUF350 domain-containing protein [candidate division CSSED10-310 bacterium]|uniref:DUF350 domain-containing protein n=1 Tax=candidate division CSSED10-310 bacterium TaxID=2855610 RepID=A0ABV6YWU9_UNCC1